jgi:ubiquinone/menaquinone biosynthesis C-methylase UbiE/uncharacterized protein YbaR (Trm112 family)
MTTIDLNIYQCPECRGRLAFDPPQTDGAERLVCQGCNRNYPIVNGIPRFVPSRNYAESFGAEWAHFPKTLLDADWQQMYRARFAQTTNFPDDLRGQTVLEVGCGPGSFTGIILSTGARVFSSDLSTSVDVCRKNQRDHENFANLSLSQANLEKLPFADQAFDKVLCLGVIQHCPDPARAYASLCRHLKPGGEIVIDCYQFEPFGEASWTYRTKHALRVVTRYMPPGLLYRLVSLTIGTLYAVKAAINKIPAIGPKLQRLIPIGELKRRDWTPEQMKQIKSLNVFDMLSPRYDNPQSVETVRGWIANEGLELIKCDIGHNGVNAKARRPLRLNAGV